ncbi:MAG: DUF4291 family protein [Crocinitomix sp.]|nr:DUF4291 family protein [Crocinitomix sp.]
MNADKNNVRAVFDAETITVYQAYSKEIALPAVKHQKFVSPFKMERMTWIKPSFLWMMYRSGWSSKKDQEHVLAIKIKREGWDWAVKNACLSHFVAEVHESNEAWKLELVKSPVRVQWDPEKDIHLNGLDYKSIQIGLSGIAVEKYVNDWIVSIEDIGQKCRNIHDLILNGRLAEAEYQLPNEELYQTPDSIDGH